MIFVHVCMKLGVLVHVTAIPVVESSNRPTERGKTTAKAECKNCRYKTGKAKEHAVTALHVGSYVVNLAL
jgi:hypothetical protein